MYNNKISFKINDLDLFVKVMMVFFDNFYEQFIIGLIYSVMVHKKISLQFEDG